MINYFINRRAELKRRSTQAENGVAIQFGPQYETGASVKYCLYAFVMFDVNAYFRQKGAKQ